MIQQQLRVRPQSPTRVSVVPHIAHPNDDRLQPDYSEYDRFEGDMPLRVRPQAGLGAQAAQRLSVLGEMTGGIVHDFRNLLMAIELGLRLAEKNSEQPEQVRTHLAAAREGLDRGVKLTSQLLAFAKQQELAAHAADINELLRKLELLLRYSAGPKTRIVLELASDMPKCLIDPLQFDVAVLNLVVNARDAMPNGGELQISTDGVETAKFGSAAPGTYVRVRVKDSGNGMPAEAVRKIFDPFFTSKGEGGTGLGLPQVRAFMQLIGGYVSVTSQQGIGTTFDLLFPSAKRDGIVALSALKADLGHEPDLSTMIVIPTDDTTR
jgi:signal transduction histidine kinase